MSAPSRSVYITNAGGGVAVISLYRPPVNAMDANVWAALLSALDACEAAAAAGEPPPVTPPLPAKAVAPPCPPTTSAERGIEAAMNAPVRAVVFASALPRAVFTAGNDLTELHVPSTSRTRFDSFWITSATFLARLYSSPLHTVAAVAGACPAGGTVLALACDERLALTADGGATVLGLNEVALGIPVPTVWGRLLARVVGWAPAEALLRGGVLLPAAAAASAGMVDELVAVPVTSSGAGNQAAASTAATRAVIAAAIRRARAQLRLADGGRVATKTALRGEFAAEWAAGAPADAARVWALLRMPQVVTTLGKVLASLARRKRDTSGEGGRGRARL